MVALPRGGYEKPVGGPPMYGAGPRGWGKLSPYLAEAAEQAFDGAGKGTGQAFEAGGQASCDGTDDGEDNAHGGVPFTMG